MTADEFIKEWNSGCPDVEVHTSGSTGTPKKIRASKNRMRESARITCQFLGLKQGQQALLCLSPDYIAGKMMIVRALEWGLRLCCIPPSSHPMAAENLPEKVDFCAMVAMQVKASLQQADERRRLMDIGHLIVGGSAIDKTLEDELHDFPNAVWSTYGMSETLSHIALRRLNGKDAEPWYRPLPNVEVGVDERGCLTVYAPLVCPTLLHTNDIAQVSHDKKGTRFIVTGRIDNVVVSGGLKIQIEEVEGMLGNQLEKPFVLTKTKDTLLGEALCLLTEDTDINKVEQQCLSLLPHYHVPRNIIHVPSIPLTDNGKPARKRAEGMAESMLAQASREEK